MPAADLVVVSNRGPLSFALDDRGAPVRGNPGGGLASALHPLLAGTGATWVSCALSEADRAAAARGLMTEPGLNLVTVAPDPDLYRMAYDVVSNATLWFVHHMLFDLVHRPRFDRHWRRAWEAYRAFNAEMAAAVAGSAPEGATVLVQDYHLTLVPALLAAARPDLHQAHFSHTPFADAELLRVLPTEVRHEMLEGMGAAACGFHTARWRDNFLSCCEAAGDKRPPTFVSPLASDPDHLLRRADSEGVAAAGRRVEELVGDRRMILRVDRVEPSKNLLRGFWAFDELLAEEPRWRERVVLVALAYPSRQTLPEYLAYHAEVELAAEQLNERWGTPGWTPVVLDVADDTDRSFAALLRYDVLLVNPLRDGLNLVAKEGPLVNRSHGVLVLSEEAGSFAELGAEALGVNPVDVAATASALARALAMDDAERARRAEALRAMVLARSPRHWLDEQVVAARGRPTAADPGD